MAKKIINSIDRTALTPNYAPAWFTPVRGKKSILWDVDGNDYVDFGGGIAVTCLGHSHPELIKVLKAQSTKLWHVSNYLYNEPALELSELLAKKTFADKVCFSSVEVLLTSSTTLLTKSSFTTATTLAIN